MEGVKVFDASEVRDEFGPEASADRVHSLDVQARCVGYVEQAMKRELEALAEHVFGAGVRHRWVSEYFPFTEPSWELEIDFDGQWMEVLGCGVMHRQLLDECGLRSRYGWAFGQGLDRLAMVLFGVADIRLFWSDDERFVRQFRGVDPLADVGALPRFEAYSKFPKSERDVSFWLPDDGDTDADNYHAHDLYDMIRSEAGDLVEDVALLDEFAHPKSGRRSQTVRIVYRAMHRSLTADECNAIQQRVRDAIEQRLACELR
jgi:phenylalanyl-tRNA synthetase alpha chain